jgi:hypothetical protein
MELDNLEEIFTRLPPEQQRLLVKRVLELKAKFTKQDKERAKFLQMLEQIDEKSPTDK